MDDIQSQMNAILEDPEMMTKIKAIAESMNQEPVTDNNEQPTETAGILPNIDISMLQKLSALAGQSSIDKNQKTLLSALAPYLNSERIRKLEKAMQASKMVGLASTLFGRTGR